MKTFAVFCAILATAYGGVVPWTAEREASAHDLFRRYCSGQRDDGDSGGVSWFCKKAPFIIKDSKRHSHTIRPAGSDKEQIVFIEAPATDYQHDIRITGQLNTNSRSKIFVVPAVDRQSVSITDDVSVDSKSSKPSIFFLKDSPRSRSRSEPETSFSEDVFSYEPETRERQTRTRNHEVSASEVSENVVPRRSNPRSRDISPALPESTRDTVLVLRRDNSRTLTTDPASSASSDEPTVVVLKSKAKTPTADSAPSASSDVPAVVALKAKAKTPTTDQDSSASSDGPTVVVLKSNPRDSSVEDDAPLQKKSSANSTGNSSPKNIDEN